MEAEEGARDDVPRCPRGVGAEEAYMGNGEGEAAEASRDDEDDEDPYVRGGGVSNRGATKVPRLFCCVCGIRPSWIWSSPTRRRTLCVPWKRR